MLLVNNIQDDIKISEDLLSLIEEIIEYTLKEEAVNIKVEISLLLVGDDKIKEINKRQRNIDMVTDVLSFPMLEYRKHTVYKDNYMNNKFSLEDLDEGKLVLGDVVLNINRAKEQSIEYNHSFNREICYLLLHSILHLLGYDHMEEQDKLKMRKREEEILNNFHIKRG